jgi:hypothetical protein
MLTHSAEPCRSPELTTEAPPLRAGERDAAQGQPLAHPGLQTGESKG